jgi:hypothetical protein
MDNRTIAAHLREHAVRLESGGANLFRARSFRTAAGQLLMLSREAADVLAVEGRVGLERLPGIGKSLAYTVELLIRTGELRTLHPAETPAEPEEDLASLPGVGLRTVEVIRDRLGLSTLEGLRAAAVDGRLADAGYPPGRVHALVAEIDRRLEKPDRPTPTDEPAVGELLALDAEYRRRARLDDLPRVAPRAFNPEGVTWLGVLREERGGWKMRALYANTAVAHRLGRTRDWVVVSFEGPAGGGQRTVVTETRGCLAGKRVVRGREAECRGWYEQQRQAVGSEPAA